MDEVDVSFLFDSRVGQKHQVGPTYTRCSGNEENGANGTASGSGGNETAHESSVHSLQISSNRFSCQSVSL